jgi:RNA polymerase sigma-70 factor (ECF subfamily)
VRAEVIHPGGAASPPVPSTLTELLQRARGVATSPLAAPELDAVLIDLIDAARDANPAIDVPLEAFLGYVAERLPDGASLPAALHALHSADLYLACACVRGDAGAIAAFDERCLRCLDRVLPRMGVAADLLAEIKQELRSRLLVGDGQPPRPKIVDFAGRGDLRGWVRVIAVREVLQRRQRARREVPVEDGELLERIATGGNPALDRAKQLYREEFQDAFQRALQALPDRERTLLRQHYLDGLTIDELGALYRTHRSTAARLIARARLVVLEATRARMMARLEVPPADLDSILRLIRSQIDISLRILHRPPT